ncbi:MAG: tRNA dihydrouridine synthase DusB [SAR86 cluster bacterium]|uniref:tRNA-dihydrouridine synthase B n=1 Tax=SAR86 cluster bacterium TaxID=2030880 RepID=A0A2A4MKL8_9GAMM|nr:MAG: tRNA dihydrouridine synthase DusB [SAR86 cluster bacterium]
MIQIGPYSIANNLLLAPMVGVSDKPFREICSLQGAGLTIGEMLTSNTQLWHNEKNRHKLGMPDITGPQAIQIAGSDPQMMANAAQLNAQRGAHIIDINMGCPAKKVLKKAAGSALLRDTGLIRQILESVVASVDIPVTLKIRTGWCEQTRNGVEVAKIAQDYGIKMLSVHGRTRACRFQGSAEYDTIAAIKQAVEIPVIANGDIDSPEKAAAVLAHTQADGLMIGRAAQGRPWIFAEIEHYLKTGEPLAEKSLPDLLQLIECHLNRIYSFYGDFKGVWFARKHVSSYIKRSRQPALYEAVEFLKRFNSETTPQLQIDCLRTYFNYLSTHREIAA